MKPLALFLERLLLCLGPAVFAAMAYDTFKDLEPSADNKNAGAFLLCAFGWLSQWKEMWALLPRQRFIVWSTAFAFGITLLLSGSAFFVWWPRDWAGWWVIIPTFLVTALVRSGEQLPSSKPTAEPQAEVNAPADEMPLPSPPPSSPMSSAPRPPRRGRPWLGMTAAVVFVLFVFGGAGSFLFTGPGGARLREKARAYFGSGEAQLALAWRCREGEGERQDFARAAYWLGRAADNGVVRAHYDLAVLAYYGLGTEADVTRARVHLQAAAEHDYAPALTMLGLIAMNDDGDRVRAMEFWQRSAGLQDGWGEHLLGSAYLQQRGAGEENIINALVHLERGRRFGVEPIQGMIEHVWATLDEADFERIADEVYRQLDGDPETT